MRRATVATLAAAALAGGAAAPAEARSCAPIRDPYAGTRYEGSDLKRITATGVSCRTARRVVRGAHRKALGLTPPPDGIRRFAWNGWTVRGDLRGSVDRYIAGRGENLVRWVFG